MFYFMPVWLFSAQDSNPNLHSYSNNQSISFEMSGLNEQKFDNSKISPQKWECYLEIFEKELKAIMEKQKKKLWTKQQDCQLLKMKEQQMDWKEIAQKIDGTNSQICRRRYFRIIQTNMRWPQQVDEQIKYQHEIKNLKWSTIVNILNMKFNGSKKYTGKMIKQRYQFYLRSGIMNKQWTVQEDMKLLNSVHQNGTLWKRIVADFQGRTQLQLKNRFNGTLKLIQKRVLLKLQNMQIKNMGTKKNIN